MCRRWRRKEPNDLIPVPLFDAALAGGLSPDNCSPGGGRSGDFKRKSTALAGVAQWTECRPANQRVTGSIPSQGTCLGCGPGPQ